MRKDIEAIYPLTPMQDGMLFHSLYAPESGVYVQQLNGTLRGEVDVAAFKLAWQRAIERHAVLRTAFVSEGLDEPRQVVGVRATMPIEAHDWRDVAADERAARLDTFLADDRRRGFKLSRAPLMRLSLFRTGDTTHHFVWTHHHLLVDGWSVALLLREVFALYAAASRGETARLPPARPFADYVEWLGRQDRARAKTFWTELLRGFATPVGLPGATGAGAPEGTAAPRVERLELTLDETATATLQRTAREHRLTVNTFVQGAWALVLARHGRSRDIVFGAVSAGRPAEIAGVDGIVGLFVNTLPLRTTVDPDAIVADWLGALQEQQSQQRQFEFTPLADVQRCSELPAGVPMFDSLLAFENYPVDASGGDTDGLALEIADMAAVERTNYPLTVQVLGTGALKLRFLFDEDRFHRHSLQTMLAHLREALRELSARPGARVRDISLLPAAERRRILSDWNGTAHRYPDVATLDAWIEQRLLLQPEAIAVESESHGISRDRLRRDANRLAHYLRRRGVGPGMLVGVCMERSPELMVALVAVLKAGGAYVPLDPDFPPERIRHMREDSSVAIVLTQRHLFQRFDEADTAAWIALDRDWDAIAQEPDSAPEPLHSADDLAYVIYTSGSTGRPKGAMNSHRGICNRLLWMGERYGLDDTDCVLQKTPLSFDVSVWELFLPLMSGARLAMARPRGHQDAAYVADAIARFGVTTLHFVPSMLGLFLEEPALEQRCASLRRVICSGEALPWAARQRFFARLGAQLHNLYGPTEAAVDVSHWDCGSDAWPGLIPIGAPVANTRLLVLDADDCLVPQGIAGELFIGGVQVGRGYWRQPRLTAERFVPDPYAERPGERLYRTGDLARWLPDGNLEFAGRIDDQVKIGGVRIEPGEVEFQLECHPHVRQAVVRVLEPRPGEKQLAAYLVPDFTNAGDDAAEPAASQSGDDAHAGTDADRLLADTPRRVLQVGCGDGALLRRHAARAERWWATDDDESRLAGLRRELAAGDAAPDPRVVLLGTSPRDLDSLPAGAFDVVLLDAAALRCDGAADLFDIVGAALRRLAPRGVLHLSRLRDLRLLRATCLRDALAGAAATATLDAVAAQVAWLAAHDETLWIDPALFAELRLRDPRITRIALTRRERAPDGAYDATLHLAADGVPAHPALALDWHDVQDIASIRATLTRERPASVRIVAVPDAAALALIADLRRLDQRGDARNAAELRARPAGAAVPDAAEWRMLAREFGYETVFGVDAADARRTTVHLVAAGRAWADDDAAPDGTARKLADLGNDPGWARRARRLAPRVRAFLQERAPQWMVPAHLVTLRELPLSPSGKVERRALPLPQSGTAPERRHVAPRTPREEVLARIWGEVLGIERVGITDNFFALGGDSIRAIRVQSKARRQGLTFPLQALFNNADIAQLAASLDEGGGAGKAATAPIEPFALLEAAERAALPAAVEDAYPLTRMQAGMLFHSELDPHTNVYHDVFTSHLRTRLDIEALRAAAADLVRRHPALRTAFDLRNYGQPLQLVHRDADIAFGYDDWRALDGAQAKERLDAWLVQEKRHHYDWNRPGLLRFHVHARSAESFQFTLSFHHSVLDGWSVAVMLAELFQLYRNRLDPAQATPVPPAPRSGPGDLVSLEARALASDEARAFWTHQMAGRDATRLPRAAGASRTRRIRVHPVAVSAGLSTRLIELARTLRVPLKSVLLAAHLRVLAATTGETSLVTGLVGSSRPESADGDRALGLYLNNLPFAFDLGSGSWSDLVTRTFRHEQALLPHRRFPLAELHRIKAQGALFETAFNFVHFHAYQAVRDSGGVDYLDGEFTQETDLALLVNGFLDLDGTGLRVTLDYDEGELTAAQVNRIAARFTRALRDMAAAPDAPHAAALLDDDELRLLRDVNATDAPRSEDDLCTRLEAQARRTPDAVALRADDRVLTYAALDLAADALAGRLAARGIGVEARVGVCLERSADLVVALIAVLKTGAAYVPLDPSHPPDRIEHALRDAGARVVLTQRDLQATLDGRGAPLLCLDDLDGEASVDFVRPPVHADQLAYVIYTSGSTGRPKGVMVSHRALVNFLDTMRERPGLSPHDVLFAVTTVAFDIAGLELFLPLTTGAQVVLASRETASDPSLLAAALLRHRASVMQATPATWRMLLAAGWDGMPGLTVLCGGEAFPADLAAALMPRCAQVWNVYGPTETTIWSARHRLDANLSRHAVPIGEPLANTQLHVLDASLHRLPPGAAGELYIGGDGLARGYLGKPGLTAERFVPDPFAPEPGRRLYRTGDQVRRLDDGTLEFLGRLDQQIKLRGFRIELGEIETVLAQAPGVQAAVAGLVADGVGEAVLACAVVAQEGTAPDLAALREFAATRLPDYMVPSRLCTIDALPRQPNGKLDRRAVLLVLQDARAARQAVHVPPETAAERLVAAIWSQVLGIGDIGVDSHFFELGGHSLSAMRLVARLRDLFQIDLPLARLFERPTVSGIVATLGDAWGSSDTVEEIARMVLELEALPEDQVERLLDG